MRVGGITIYDELTASPATPPSGQGLVYVKTDGHIYHKNDGGTEAKLSPTDSGWLNVGQFGQDAFFQNGWFNFAQSWQAASYRKRENQVFLRGLVSGGAIGQAIFTLPVGYRPLAATMYAGIATSQASNAPYYETGFTNNGGGMSYAGDPTGDPDPDGTTGPSPSNTNNADAHNHGMNSHTHTMDNHTHEVNHSHNMNHFHGVTVQTVTSAVGTRINVFSSGAVSVESAGQSNGYIGIWGSFFTD